MVALACHNPSLKHSEGEQPRPTASRQRGEHGGTVHSRYRLAVGVVLERIQHHFEVMFVHLSAVLGSALTRTWHAFRAIWFVS